MAFTNKLEQKAYTREQVDFCRYMKEDCNLSFAEIQILFQSRFTDVFRDSNQCFSSRVYRDNVVPQLDDNGKSLSGNLLFDSKGKLLLTEAKVRDRTTPEGKEKCIPYTLVDKWPHRAIKYDWVSEEHKHIARLILQGVDPSDREGSRYPFPVSF
ncbi:hypothetical protein BJ878DRAFT_416179 [Calycina marina]|uniref:Uncharacterized protein n=1 Tax=Calycina marina TaxID=1763456 RepID=A0A9P7Z737_9HELO|nr:hypothetical protein BJ878DRAFT_416179 [Calycina marina]